jgi:ankyrin repeat protein
MALAVSGCVAAWGAVFAVNDALTPKEYPPRSVFFAENGDLENVKLHVDNRRDKVDERKAGGWTPLMAAALNGHTEVVEYLLGAGANPNVEDWLGRTAVTLAAVGCHERVMSALVAAGAERRTFVRDDFGKPRDIRRDIENSLSGRCPFDTGVRARVIRQLWPE